MIFLFSKWNLPKKICFTGSPILKRGTNNLQLYWLSTLSRQVPNLAMYDFSVNLTVPVIILFIFWNQYIFNFIVNQNFLQKSSNLFVEMASGEIGYLSR
jgi:hypothetical protein